ncbi:aldehyde dehydrogenase family protein [Streptomyces sp. XM4011]|uniref:aldehyde dehydrogenase family protein n=1 Tax=Streptomyces TaxID=1883 RepID=UPI001FFB233F|nr:aldehyde dehydrogenase family protein [Streptomyces sp. XM4011]MCK1813210.1 aldehyde dehydrogenase family protein [Streptomyces sp. XM4011]
MSADTTATIVERARAAQRMAAGWTQHEADRAVAAMGWHIHHARTARELAALAFEETGLGDPEALYEIHRRRVLGTLRDLHGAATTGVLEHDPGRGLTRYAKPVGLIAAGVPATAPCSNIACNALQMVKTRNAVVFTANPRSLRSAQRTVAVLRDALARVSAPPDLVACLPVSGREPARRLMGAADLVVAVGGPGTVRRAYESGTPALSAGVGNPVVIVDETADPATAAAHIVRGAGYNNGTSCSSESNVLVQASLATTFAAELACRGAHLCTPAEGRRLREALWPDNGALDRTAAGQSPAILAKRAGITLDRPAETTALAIPAERFDPADPVFGEKLAPVLTLLRYDAFATARDLVTELLRVAGLGHSCAIHTSRADRIEALAESAPAARVMVNQSTAHGNSGSFTNGLPFTSTVASGTWGGCSVSENVTWRHFLNTTTVSHPLAPRVPDVAELFAAYRGGAEEDSGTGAPRAAAGRNVPIDRSGGPRAHTTT